MTSGIYCFKHKSKPFIYIGSSVNIQERYKQHCNAFKSKTHVNSSLQEDFLRGKLSFDVLAKGISKDNLIKMEQEYCTNFLDMGYLLYNSKLPRPSNYNKDMIVSKKFYKSSLDNDKLKYQEERLNECFDIITSLRTENRRLKRELGYEIDKNIFNEILEVELEHFSLEEIK